MAPNLIVTILLGEQPGVNNRLDGMSTAVNSDALRNRGTRPFQRMQTEKDLRSAAKRNRARRRRYRRVLAEDIVEFLRADGFRQIAVHPRG